MLLFILVLALTGLIVGGLARLAVPGPDPMSIWMTMGSASSARSVEGSSRASSSAVTSRFSSRWWSRCCS
jgi:hypothetical protein